MEEAILNEITLYCRDECCSSDSCPEDECVLFRIEKLICMEGDKNDLQGNY